MSKETSVENEVPYVYCMARPLINGDAVTETATARIRVNVPLPSSCIRNSIRSTGGRLPRTRCTMQEHNLGDGSMCTIVYRASNGRAQPLRHAFWEYMKYISMLRVRSIYAHDGIDIAIHCDINMQSYAMNNRNTNDFSVTEISDFQNTKLTEA